MKEIIAIIRMDKVNKTKDALLKEGFPSLTCKKVLGRGKKRVNYKIYKHVFSENEVLISPMAEQIWEEHRLMPKRMIIMVVEDKNVERVVNTIISINKNGKPGDGKIFVSSIDDVVRVRTGETGINAI